MNTKNIARLIAVGEIAVELIRVEDESNVLYDQYKFAIRDYEAEHGPLGSRIDAGNPEHADAINFTAPEYCYYLDAVRRKNNLKKRLRNAARKVSAECAH